jgi:hypothetical protein
MLQKAEMVINLFRWLQRKENMKILNLIIDLGASANTGRRTPAPSSEDTLEAPTLKLVRVIPKEPDFAWPFPDIGSQTGVNARPKTRQNTHQDGPGYYNNLLRMVLTVYYICRQVSNKN